jgi:apolipoprotein N-acyltransferase
MRRVLLSLAAPAACGVALGLAFPTAHWYVIAWFALAPLVYLSALRPCAKWGALQWFIAGWAFHSFLLQWLVTNIFWAGGWAVIGYQILVLALALIWGLLGGVWSILLRRAPHLGALLFAGLFLIVEWLHANLASGFGWSALAYSQGPDLPLLQWASIGGTALVALPIVYFNAALGLFFARVSGRWVHLGAAIALAIVMHAGGVFLMGQPDYHSRPLRAGVYQSNYPNEMKWDGEYTIDMVERAVKHSARLEEYQPVDLMVWPEALVMFDYRHPELLEPMRGYAVDNETTLLTGTVRTEEGKGFNSSVIISKSGEVTGHYDKVHLAPFGEYVPFADLIPFVQQVVRSAVDAGDEQKVLESDGIRVGTLICFETLFPPMAAKLRAMDSRLLAVITNLAWFGSSNAIGQELEIARVRAIETRLPLVHASNTGISGAFDPWGRFESVDSWATFDGQLSQREGVMDPMAFAHRRALGAFDIAAPASHPMPWGPVYMPFIFMAMTALIAGLAFLPDWKRMFPAAAEGATPSAPAPATQVSPKKGEAVFPPPPDDISI